MAKVGEVIVGFKIYPKSLETDLQGIAKSVGESLPGQARVSKSRIEPVAFGLNALILDVVVPEVEGLLDMVEQTIRSNADVEDVEVVSQRRALRL
ncbi:MAG: elongation factor 1-beta [Candidatus Brockarchaeota archaeon]|nr:elongation factor 1-beta [Candidatus Brockarchaeota archaeon]